MHPLIEEIQRFRLGQVRDQVFNRWQRELRDVIQPLLDEREALVLLNAQLTEENAKLQAKAKKVTS